MCTTLVPAFPHHSRHVLGGVCAQVKPLATAIQAIRAPVTLVVAPMHREAAGALSEALKDLGSSHEEYMLTLVSSDADEWSGGWPALASLVPEMPALAYRVIVVKWPLDQ